MKNYRYGLIPPEVEHLLIKDWLTEQEKIELKDKYKDLCTYIEETYPPGGPTLSLARERLEQHKKSMVELNELKQRIENCARRHDVDLKV